MHTPTQDRIITDIRLAADTLAAGGLVAFPTETVYGLGADASSPEAVARLYRVKGRPENHPVIVHLGRPEQLSDWAVNIPDAAYRLAEAFWPGPLTMILPKAPHVSDRITGGQPTVGLRMPDHPVAMALLRAVNRGIAAPSANRFGHVSPTRAAHVIEELRDDVDYVLDGGDCPVGIESTIVSLTGETPRLLRPGHIRREQLEAILGTPVAAEPGAERAPGTLPSHYAPRTPLQVLSAERLDARAQQLRAAGETCAIIGYSNRVGATHPMPPEPAAYAQKLYALLRTLDHENVQWILVEAPPDEPAWAAVADRLRRAGAAHSPTS